jgi:hypothetical protein
MNGNRIVLNNPIARIVKNPIIIAPALGETNHKEDRSMTDFTFDNSCSLLESVIAKLSNMTETDYMEIWRDTGLPYFWVRKIANRDIKNPGVNRIQFLYEYLNKKKLDV